ncbi:MAG: DUF1080 domain-containing protein [Verrucomicrobia bacterium]|jgi:hypothetical protein|nr:DUF1080 domain-containing protein [Verrucomicrobiota bacterium]|tara:strand:- start:30026 stop:30733 length:708 start_codon:yes stop_codon:yes gene_type:complete
MIPKYLPFTFLAIVGVAMANPAANITGNELGWASLSEKDFVRVNSAEDTWSFDDEAQTISCTGQPISVMSTAKAYTNFELVLEWKHLKPAGNSGVFVWTSKACLDELKGPGLPNEGIEVQILDLGYKESYEKSSGKPADWFTSHGDVFPVKKAKLTPFPPISPDGSRSFPTAETTKPHGEWNHYYVRAINGEIRLWVNGTEVSGGNGAQPNNGHLCLESEGSPIEFRNLKIRELP